MINSLLQFDMFRKKLMDILSIHVIIYMKAFDSHKISVKSENKCSKLEMFSWCYILNCQKD